jgi:thiol-disulfide isomerase/thioredoxin
MSNFYFNIQRIFGPYFKYIALFVIVVIFVLVGFYGYKRFFSNNNEAYKNVANMNLRDPEIVVYFFFADWCPHCTKAKPQWTAFSNEHNDSRVNNYNIQCKSVDCTDNSTNKDLMKQYNVDSFPTVIMVKDGNVISYDAKITTETLTKFVSSATSS